MAAKGMFGGKSTYTLTGSETFVDSDVIHADEVEKWQGLDAFVASITGSGTVTPTIYYHFGNGLFGPAHTLSDNTSSKNATFTVSQAFECYLRGQNHFTPCEGWKIRFSVTSHSAGDILSASASVK